MCACPLCAAAADVSAAADARRARIEQLRDDALAAFRAGDAEAAVAAVVAVAPLVRQEELFPLYSELLENLARIWWAAGDKERGARHARQSLALLAEQGYIAASGAAEQERQLAALLRSFEEGQ